MTHFFQIKEKIITTLQGFYFVNHIINRQLENYIFFTNTYRELFVTVPSPLCLPKQTLNASMAVFCFSTSKREDERMHY